MLAKNADAVFVGDFLCRQQMSPTFLWCRRQKSQVWTGGK